LNFLSGFLQRGIFLIDLFPFIYFATLDYLFYFFLFCRTVTLPGLNQKVLSYIIIGILSEVFYNVLNCFFIIPFVQILLGLFGKSGILRTGTENQQRTKQKRKQPFFHKNSILYH